MFIIIIFLGERRKLLFVICWIYCTVYPQGSILDPLLFNINLCNLFLSEYSSEFSNFADDTTPYECGKNYDEVTNKLENTIEKLFNWFQCNNFKANASKCHFFLSPYKPVTIKTKGSAIESSNSEKLLGVTIDSKLSFDDHITNLCSKTSQKLLALSKVASHMSFNKKKILLKTFITLQFNYCPLVWMCHSRGLNNRISNLHERALRIAYQDKKSDFEALLKNGKSVIIHVRNPHYLVTEIYKVKNNISPEIMRDIHFQKNENYSVRSGTYLASRNMRTTLGKRRYQTQEPKNGRHCQGNLKIFHRCKFLKIN